MLLIGTNLEKYKTNPTPVSSALAWLSLDEWRELLNYPYPGLPECCEDMENLRSLIRKVRREGLNLYHAELFCIYFNRILAQHQMVYFPLINRMYDVCEGIVEKFATNSI